MCARRAAQRRCVFVAMLVPTSTTFFGNVARVNRSMRNRPGCDGRDFPSPSHYSAEYHIAWKDVCRRGSRRVCNELSAVIADRSVVARSLEATISRPVPDTVRDRCGRQSRPKKNPFRESSVASRRSTLWLANVAPLSHTSSLQNRHTPKPGFQRKPGR